VKCQRIAVGRCAIGIWLARQRSCKLGPAPCHIYHNIHYAHFDIGQSGPRIPSKPYPCFSLPSQRQSAGPDTTLSAGHTHCAFCVSRSCSSASVSASSHSLQYLTLPWSQGAGCQGLIHSHLWQRITDGMAGRPARTRVSKACGPAIRAQPGSGQSRDWRAIQVAEGRARRPHSKMTSCSRDCGHSLGAKRCRRVAFRRLRCIFQR